LFDKDLSDATDNEYDTGMRIADIATHDDFWPMTKNYAWLAGHVGIFTILTIFFDNVLYMRRPPWFFCMPSYWTGTSKKSMSTQVRFFLEKTRCR